MCVSQYIQRQCHSFTLPIWQRFCNGGILSHPGVFTSLVKRSQNVTCWFALPRPNHSINSALSSGFFLHKKQFCVDRLQFPIKTVVSNTSMCACILWDIASQYMYTYCICNKMQLLQVVWTEVPSMSGRVSKLFGTRAASFIREFKW